MTKYVNTNQWQKELFARTEGYADNVRKLYDSNLTEIIDLVRGTELEDGKPFSFAEYGYEDQVNKILRKLYASVYKEIRKDATQEWQLSDLNNDTLVKGVFGADALSDHHFLRFFGRNKDAMDAFLDRKGAKDGLNLSQRVWDYTKQHKTNLEDSLDLAIGEGTPANSLASKITQYLREPDRVYKRFRIRTGTNEDGTPKYGSILKRRTFDKETGLYKWVDEPKSAYKPGTGVYRSSYRNAQRLARTETNIAYRTADYERWQQLDFVIGIEIRLSNNHPYTDICDFNQGVYPKTFKWTGWHSNCRCYQVSKLASPEEIDEMMNKIMDGEDTFGIAQQIDTYPKEYIQWIRTNASRIVQAEKRGTLPYFIRDNKRITDAIINSDTSTKNIQKKLKRIVYDIAVNGTVVFASFEPFSPAIINALQKLKSAKEREKLFNEIISDTSFIRMDVRAGNKNNSYYMVGNKEITANNWNKSKLLAHDINMNGDPVYFLPEAESTSSADALTKIKGKWAIVDFKVLTTTNHSTIFENIAKGYNQSKDGIVVKLVNAQRTDFENAISELIEEENVYHTNVKPYSIGRMKVVNKRGEVIDFTRKDLLSGKYKKKMKGFF
jgi:hypothetical protein